MKLLFNKIFIEHNKESEIEGSYRMEMFSDLPDSYAYGEEYLSMVHEKNYIQSIKKACQNSESLAEVQLNPSTWDSACLSVGLSIEASKNFDFSLVRPPGHHATYDKGHGFCFFNNLAIAVKYQLALGKRVFILDIDSHHGDGTQSIFYESPDVFYCSIHQLHTYPFTGSPTETGKGSGLGTTMNLPMVAGAGDREFLRLVDTALDAALKFNPDIIAVSAGFDGYHNDRLLNLNMTEMAYYECAYKLRKQFKNIFAVLEGGYHQQLRTCVNMFIDGINKGSKRPRPNWDPNLSIG